MQNSIEDHIKVGTVLWYGGNTSTFSWNCPADIIKVVGNLFYVRSWDDGRIQNQPYTKELEEYSPDSRKSMIIPDDQAMNNWMKNLNINFKSIGTQTKTMGNVKGTAVIITPDLGKMYYESLLVLIDRWCLRRNIGRYHHNRENDLYVWFAKVEDAMLFMMSFSSGATWEAIDCRVPISQS